MDTCLPNSQGNPEGEIGLGRRLAYRLRPLALVIGLLIGLGLPAPYYFIQSDALRRTATIYAQELSRKLLPLILEDPAHWKYQAHRYEQVLLDFLPYRDVAAIQVLDETGQPIAGYEHLTVHTGEWWNLHPPRGSAPIFFNNHTVGTVQVAVSRGSLVRVTLTLVILSTATGVGLAALVYLFPVGVVTAMEAQADRLRSAAKVSEQRFQNLVQGLDAIVWEAEVPADAAQRGATILRFSFVSQQAERILGHPGERWLAGPEFWGSLIHSKDREQTIALRRGAIAEARDHELEYRAVAADGRAVWVRDIVQVELDGDGRVRRLRGLLLDLTEQKRSEEALRQREKLAGMGELLAGVAHELNNPLSVVLGQVTLLRMKFGAGGFAQPVEEIIRAGGRCARIVRNFLALARQRPPERKPVQLNQVVQEAVELLAYPLRVDTVEVRLDLAPDLPVLWADPHQLSQVVVNLVGNAYQAMRRTPLPRRLILTTRLDSRRGQVRLEIADTGPGIPPAIQARIFEPFFTTKPSGEGTGLGLSLCLGIIERHGGTIQVESPPGRGTMVRIELPVEAPPVATPEAGAAETLPLLPGKRIMVVDDEPAVANLLAETLSTDGYQVETAVNGAAALDKLRERAYDLILSDIKMPELDGPGLYRAVERRHPDLRQRFLFVTGDTLSPETERFLKQTAVPALSKPFDLFEVRRLVRRTLEAPSAKGTLAEPPAVGGPPSPPGL